jgi:hypothetical protein
LSGNFNSVVTKAVVEQDRRRRQIQCDARRIEEILARDGTDAIHSLPDSTDELALCDALLARSWALRHEDPALMLESAWLAFYKAQKLDARSYGSRQASDPICRAWAEMGNAYRVGDQLTQAVWALGHARQVFEIGTGDEELKIRLVELDASLAADRRYFDIARFKLEQVFRFYQKRSDDHRAGRTLILQGLYTGYAGDPVKALDLLVDGVSLVGESKEPSLIYAARHNQLLFLIDCHRYKEAKRFRVEYSRELSLCSARINRARFRHLESRIDAGLGNFARAEAVFEEVRLEFEKIGRPYDVALASLDLAVVLLAQSKTKEAKAVTLKAVDTFLSLDIERESILAVMLLRETFEMERVTVRLLSEVTDYMRKADYSPEKPFTPSEL